MFAKHGEGGLTPDVVTLEALTHPDTFAIFLCCCCVPTLKIRCKCKRQLDRIIKWEGGADLLVPYR